MINFEALLSMIFAFFTFFILSVFLFFWGRKIGDWQTFAFLQTGWVIKCLAAGAFFYVYAEIYGKGQLVEDAGAYIEEAKILNTIFVEDKEDYFNIIFNRGDFEKTITERFMEVKISRIGPPSFLVNDTRNQIKLISLVTLVIGDENWTIFAFFNLLSFLGLLVLWRELTKRSKLKPIYIFAFLLLPMSLLFWTSSPLKESTSLVGLSLLFAFLLQKNKSFKWFLVGLLGLMLAWSFKPYIVVVLAFSFLIYFLFEKIIRQKRWSYGILLFFFVAMAWYFSVPKKVLFTLSDKQFDFVNVARGGVHMEGDTCFYFLEKKNRDKIAIIDSMVLVKEPVRMIAIEKGKIRREQYFTLYPNKEKLRFEYEQFGGSSFFKTKAIDRNWGNLFLAIPEAVANSFLRPFPWSQFFSVQNTLLFIENLFFIFLLYLIVRKKKNIPLGVYRNVLNVLLIGSILFAIIIGLTTPVSGAIVRYRIPIHLFIILSFIITTFKYESNK